MLKAHLCVNLRIQLSLSTNFDCSVYSTIASLVSEVQVVMRNCTVHSCVRNIQYTVQSTINELLLTDEGQINYICITVLFNNPVIFNETCLANLYAPTDGITFSVVYIIGLLSLVDIFNRQVSVSTSVILRIS